MEEPIESDINFKFRLYTPQNEELDKYVDKLQAEPVETERMIQEMIQKAKEQVDKQEITQLAPRKVDSDLKRIMKPEIDELTAETTEILIKMAQHKIPTQ